MKTKDTVFGYDNDNLAFESWLETVCYDEIDQQQQEIVIGEVRYRYELEWSELYKMLSVSFIPLQLLGDIETQFMTELLLLLDPIDTIEIKGEVYFQFPSGTLLHIVGGLREVLVEQLRRPK